MHKVVFSGEHQVFVDAYDKQSYTIWNAKDGQVAATRKFIRAHYMEAQEYRCAYCRIDKKEGHGMAWDVEHILPKSLYPAFLFEPGNLSLVCKDCNTAKGNVEVLCKPNMKLKEMPCGKQDYLIVHPHFDTYSEHFEVSIVAGRRRYRTLNSGKAKFTYINCNFFRFDHQFAEWESFDAALVEKVSEFLDRCPADANPMEIKRMLGHLKCETKVDFV